MSNQTNSITNDTLLSEETNWQHPWSDSCGCGASLCVPANQEDLTPGSSSSATATSDDTQQNTWVESCGCGALLFRT